MGGPRLPVFTSLCVCVCVCALAVAELWGQGCPHNCVKV